MKKILFFIVSSILVFATTVYYRLGAYKEVSIEVKQLPEFHLLYKEHFGAYHKISEIISTVEAWAKSNNYNCKKTFGEYLDDPRTIEERRLRSLGGCVLEIKPIADTPFTFKTIPTSRYIVAHFSGAPSLGPLKVYPKVEDYMKNLGIKITLKNTEWKTYLEDMEKRRYQLIRSAWSADYNDPNSFFDMFVTNGGNNRTGWSNEKYDKLLLKSQVEPDKAKRMLIFQEMEVILVEEEMPILPLYITVNNGLLKENVHGWYENLLSFHPFKYIWLE